VPDVEEQEEQRRQELLKLYFEFFKHFTTLGAAAALALLAVYREGLVEQQELSASLVLFAVASFLATFGMRLVLNRFGSGKAAGLFANTLVSAIFFLFGFGVLFFVAQATREPFWLLGATTGVLLLTLLAMLYIKSKSRAS
jgi:hypothetical protein